MKRHFAGPLLALAASFAFSLLALAVRTAPVFAPAAAVAVATLPASAQASDDRIVQADGGQALILVSDGGSSASAALPLKGVPISLQSQSCAFHYQACTSSSCSALQTDFYVPQYQPMDVPLKNDHGWIAAACDGTSSGTITVNQTVLP